MKCFRSKEAQSFVEGSETEKRFLAALVFWHLPNEAIGQESVRGKLKEKNKKRVEFCSQFGRKTRIKEVNLRIGFYQFTVKSENNKNRETKIEEIYLKVEEAQ